jgi:hypothetical protein
MALHVSVANCQDGKKEENYYGNWNQLKGLKLLQQMELTKVNL